MSSISPSTPPGYSEPVDPKDADPQVLDHVVASADADAQRSLARQVAPTGGLLLGKFERLLGHHNTAITQALAAPNFKITANDGGKPFELDARTVKGSSSGELYTEMGVSDGMNHGGSVTFDSKGNIRNDDAQFMGADLPDSTAGAQLFHLEAHEDIAIRARQMITNVLQHGTNGTASTDQMKNALKLVDSLDRQVAGWKGIVAKCPEANFALSANKSYGQILSTIGATTAEQRGAQFLALWKQVGVAQQSLATRPGLTDDERKLVGQALHKVQYDIQRSAREDGQDI